MPAKKSDESKLAKLKKEYKKFQEKYDLPSFNELNENFGVEKAAEVETDFTIREIRKQISEKAYNYLRFVETLINPVSAPMSIMTLVKTFGVEEKERLTDVYKKLMKNELQLVSVDIEYSEKKEADFIKNTNKIWKEIQKDFLEVIKAVEKSWEEKAPDKNRKYFG
ncbi:MAG: hypothetical protein AABX93_01680 [Nanoarchaeota archaeon]